MKKWNGNSFNKTKLATAVAVVSLGLMAGGCGSDGDRSTSVTTGDTGSVTQINRAEGTITGHVQDTNGNPIAGATVSVAGQSVTTDAAGNYIFDSVQVLNATGTDDNANGPIGNVLQVVVQVEGYLGATVTVTPLAQVDANDSGNGNASTDVNAANMFLDGFLAPAGTAVLPKLGASITGTLRLGSTGEPLPLQTVALDFADVLGNNGGTQEQPINGVAISYAAPTIETVTTDADGKFTFTNLPEDSAFNLAVQGWTVAGIANPGDVAGNLVPGGNTANNGAMLVGTSNENITQVLGMVSVAPIADVDLIPPVVWSVNTVKNPYDVQNRAPADNPARPAGILGDDEVAGITINFSEQIADEIDENSIVIWNSTAGVYMNSGTEFTATRASDGRSVRIDFTTPFDGSANQFLEVNLLVDDFVDTAGNVLVEASTLAANAAAIAGFGGVNPVPNVPGPALGAGNNLVNDIAYDGMNGNVAKNQFLRLDLCTYGADLQGASQVDLTQLTVSAANAAGTNPAELADQQAYSGAFNDTEDNNDWFGDGNIVDQLNVAEAEARLEALGTALYGATNVEVDRPLITFTTTDAASYQITAATGAAALNVTLATANVQDTDAAADSVVVAGQPAGQVIEVLVDGAVAGTSTATITPRDGFGNSQGSTTITLVDNVEPTVILQSAHGLAGVTGAGVVQPFGDGAEISDGGQNAAQSPAWRVNGGHFTESRSGLGNAPDPLAQDLEDASSADLVKNGAADGGDQINIVYDATGWNAVEGNQSFETAIAVSESLASATITYNGTANISNVEVENDVTQSVWGDNGNGQVIAADIVRFTVSDIEAMAADAGATIDLTGSTDLAGNVAAANAFATVVDNLPPLVESAIYDSTGITVVFNENVSIPAGGELRIDLDGSTQVVSLVAGPFGGCNAGEQSPSVNGATLFVPQCYLDNEGNFVYNDAFDTANANGPLGNYAENDANYGTINNAAPRHTSLVWSTIEDSAGNSWEDTLPTDANDPNPWAGSVTDADDLVWTGLGARANNTGQSPIFAMIDGLGPFQVTTNNAAFDTTLAAGANQSFTASFTHPFKVNANNDARRAIGDGDGTVTGAECAAFFDYTTADADTFNGGTCTIAFVETGTTASNNNRSSGFTVTFSLAGGDGQPELADKVEVDTANYIFESALTDEVVGLNVSPSK